MPINYHEIQTTSLTKRFRIKHFRLNNVIKALLNEM